MEEQKFNRSWSFVDYVRLFLDSEGTLYVHKYQSADTALADSELDSGASRTDYIYNID